MRKRRGEPRPWWQITETSRGAFGMSLGWIFFGIIGLLGAMPNSGLRVVSGFGFVLLGLTQVVAGIKLRDLERTASTAEVQHRR